MINNKLFKHKKIFTSGFFLLFAITLQPFTTWAADDNPQQGNQYYLFTGETGAGVSTIINYARGHQFKLQKVKNDSDDDFELTLHKKGEKELAEMGQEDSGKTEEVKAYELEPGGVYSSLNLYSLFKYNLPS